jgi:hypothetical protein
MPTILQNGGVQTARIGYENIFALAEATITASSEASGFEKENVADWKQYDWWAPTAGGTQWIAGAFTAAKQVDYMAVWGHNLHDVAGSVKAQYSTDAGVTWVDATTAVHPSTGRTIFININLTFAANWRCLTASNAAVIIAGVQFGRAIVFDRDVTNGFSPASLSPVVESKIAKSELGVNLGVSVLRTGVNGSIELTNLSPDWIRNEWSELVTHLNFGKPCVFSWDNSQHADEAILIWKSEQIPAPSYITPMLMSASLSFKGIL